MGEENVTEYPRTVGQPQKGSPRYNGNTRGERKRKEWDIWSNKDW